MRRTLAVSFISFMLWLGTAAPEFAQQAGDVDVRGTAGVARQGGIFGDDAPLTRWNTGFTVGVETRRAPREWSGLAFEIVLPTHAVTNPHLDERIRPLYVLVGGEFGRRTFARVVGGAAVGLWTGTETESGIDFLPATGFSIGRHFDAGTVRITPELVGRSAFGPGVATWGIGVQVALGRRQ